MTSVKSYTAPFWFMMVLVVIVAAIYLFTYKAIFGMYTGILLRYLIYNGIYLVILVFEGIIYWRLRKRSVSKKLVWAHILLLYFALVFLHVLFVIVLTVAGRTLSREEYSIIVNKISRVRFVLYWSGIGLSQVIFIFIIIKGFFRKQNDAEPDDETPDLLNEFH